MRKFPFGMPNGWFQVAYSGDVKPGDVLPLKYFGVDLVLFRTMDGRAEILDAHCPHLGAHLGYGGKVVEDTIECPFHAWRFNGMGECVAIPYATKIPHKAKSSCWPVSETNGLIMVWHHAEGLPSTWRVPKVPEYKNEEWTPYERRRWTIRTRNQEMAENAVDSAHFKYVHGALYAPEAKAETTGHILRMNTDTMTKTKGGSEVTGHIESVSYGFGFSTTRFTGFVETLLVASPTPIDEEYTDVRFSFTVKKIGGHDITQGIGKAFVAEVSRQLEQDTPIWENKKYVNPPVLCDGDGPIGMYRKWVRQFYSAIESEQAETV